MDSKDLRHIAQVYEAVYGGGKKEEKKDTRLVVTAADKKANTKAYQNYKAGNKAYKAADHLKEDEKYGYDKDGNSLNPVDIEKRKKKDDDLAGSPNKKGKKAKRWWDDDGDGKGYEDGEVDGKFPKKKKVKEEVELQEKQKDTPDQVAAVIDMYRSKKGTGEAVKDTEKGDKKAAKKERDYAAFEREKMKKDDPDWKHKKGSTTESVDADYIEIVREIKSAETQADIKRWGALKESGNFTDEELDTIVEADIADILARLEKKRISKGGDPEESPLPAMRKYHANKKKVKEEVEIELDEAERDLGDRLHRKRKLYDKTTKKAMEYARREGEAAGHDRFNMGRLDREMDKVKDKMNKEK